MKSGEHCLGLRLGFSVQNWAPRYETLDFRSSLQLSDAEMSHSFLISLVLNGGVVDIAGGVHWTLHIRDHCTALASPYSTREARALNIARHCSGQ